MSKTRISLMLLGILSLLSLGSSHSSLYAAPEGLKRLEIGDKVPDFTLPGVDGKDHSLNDFKDAKLLFVVFTCNHCPTAQAYEPRIVQLHKDYQDKGVALVAISPNDDLALRLDELGYSDVGDSFEDMKLRAEEQNFQFPYLYDGDDQKVSLEFGVAATPQVFLFDHERKLRYVGRIDDSDVREPTVHDARNAIDALLEGKPVPVERTRTIGCSTKWSDKRSTVEESNARWDREPVSLQPIDEAGLEALVKNDTDKLLVINVWASWCGPCIEELPEFVKINRMYRNRPFKMVTVSIDEPEQKNAALKFLKEQKVSCTNYHSSVENKDRVAEILDAQWNGPVPYTLVVRPGGEVVYRKEGPIESLELRREIVKVLGRTYGAPPLR